MDVTQGTISGDTPLSIAYKNGNEKVAAFPTEHGADVSQSTTI